MPRPDAKGSRHRIPSRGRRPTSRSLCPVLMQQVQATDPQRSPLSFAMFHMLRSYATGSCHRILAEAAAPRHNHYLMSPHHRFMPEDPWRTP
eukprot:gene12390-biopygen1194